MVESRLRQLVLRLELVDGISVAHPFVKSFDRVTLCLAEEEANDAVHGKFIDRPADEEVDQSKVVKTVYTSIFYIGLVINTAGGQKRVDISWPTAEFTKLVKTWDAYEEASMGIVVSYMRKAALPEEVYEGDEPDKTAASAKRKRDSKAQRVRIYTLKIRNNIMTLSAALTYFAGKRGRKETKINGEFRRRRGGEG